MNTASSESVENELHFDGGDLVTLDAVDTDTKCYIKQYLCSVSSLFN